MRTIAAKQFDSVKKAIEWGNQRSLEEIADELGVPRGQKCYLYVNEAAEVEAAEMSYGHTSRPADEVLFLGHYNYRQITPHKGGRTERVFARITPEAKQRILQLAEDRGCSVADLVEHWIFSE